MKQVYGNAFAKTVQGRVASKTVTPNYPRNYADLKHEYYCESKRRSTSADDVNEGESAVLSDFKIPEECKKVASTANSQ